MVRLNPAPISVVDELITLYTSGQPGKKRWFVRKMKTLPEQDQDKVWSLLELKGYERPKKDRATDEKGTDEKKRPADEKGTQEKGTQEKERNAIYWSDQEWDRLAGLVWNIRKNDPTDSLVGLCRRAVEQFPQSRRRNIRVNNELKPLIERITAMDKQYAVSRDSLADMESKLKAAEAKVQNLIDDASQMNRDSVLMNATDEEVEVYFGERVLDLLPPDEVLKRYDRRTLLSYIPVGDMLATVVTAGVEMFIESRENMTSALTELASVVREQRTPASTVKPAHTRPSMPLPRPAQRLMKVTVFGLLPEQARTVENRLKGRAYFNFVDKNRRTADAIPPGQDIIVLAANFISHSTQDQAKKAAGSAKIVIHHGGTDTMIRKLDEMLPQLEFAS